MKHSKIIILIILCLVAASGFINFTLSGNSAIEQSRMAKCISCCAGKQQICYNMLADSRLCAAEFQNCAATCRSEGNSPSEWSDCWVQSGK